MSAASLVHKALNEDGTTRDPVALAELIDLAHEASAGVDMHTWAKGVIDDPAAYGATQAEAALIAQLADQLNGPTA